jgi:PAS domain S-box-containing protein
VLVVEDNPTTLKMLTVALRTAEFDVMAAADGEAALALARERPPDVVIQDLVLPDMDGFELLRRLRTLPGSESVPVLALSGFLARMEEARDRHLGFTAFVAKPIEPSRLVEIVHRCLPRSPPRSPRPGHGQRVLVVDDDPAGRKLLAVQLGLLGYAAEEHSTAAGALVRARQGDVDAVLSDLAIPLMDGFELCAALRRDPRTSTLPVVLYSSLLGEPEDHREAIRVGASALLPRGASVDELVQALGAPARPAEAGLERPWPRLRERLAEAAVRIAHLEKRGALHRAELSLLGSVVEAVTHERPLADALREMLARCMSAAGAARGLVALQGPGPGLALVAAHGFPAGATEAVASAIAGDPASRAAEPRVVHAAGDVGPAWLRAAQADAALIAPFALPDGAGGLLALFGREGDFDEDWEDFASAVAAQMSQVVVLSRAFGERRAAEAALRAAQDLLEHVYRSSPAVTYVLGLADGQAHSVWVSENIERLQGSTPAEALLPGWWQERVHPADVPTATDFGPLLETGEQRRVYRFRDERSGSYRWVSDRQRLVQGDDDGPPQIVGTWVDVTDQVEAEDARRASEERNRELEEQLRHAQKLEGIGRLAGGVAHDFNNLLGVIAGRAELLQRHAPAGSALDAGLAEILDTSQRAADVTRQLLAFSRKQVMRLEPIDLAAAIGQIERLLRRLIGEDVELVTRLPPDLGVVFADAGQLSQVLVNLAVNARDAMPRGGRLSLAGHTVTCDEQWCASRPNTRPGPYACIEVSDTGEGISPDVQARIFEPFFTTKEPGRGTGLGLAMAYGVMAQHGGSIEVESELGAGTTFRLWLPLHAGRGAVLTPPAAPDAEPARAAGGDEVVLVVEDDAGLRSLIHEVLAEAGYTVHAAATPEAALAATLKPPPVALIADVVMPGLSGPELAQRLAARLPGLRVLFISGYSGDALPGREGLPPGLRLLSKPFRADELLASLRSMLDEV